VKQQQPDQHCSALWQPQARAWQMNGTLPLRTGAAGSGTPKAVSK
jgi:hypothetical protein